MFLVDRWNGEMMVERTPEMVCHENRKLRVSYMLHRNLDEVLMGTRSKVDWKDSLNPWCSLTLA